MSNDKTHNSNEVPSLSKDNKPVNVTPTVSKEALKKWENTVSTYIGSFTKISNSDLAKAVAASLNHFENVGSRSATELGRLYKCLVENGAKGLAKSVAIIAKHGYGITVKYDEDTGTVKHSYKVRVYNAIGTATRSKIMAALGEGELKAVVLELTPPKEEQVKTVQDKCEAITKRFSKIFEEVQTLSNEASKDDLSAIWSAIYKQKQIIAELEEKLDKAKGGAAKLLEAG